MTTHCSLEKLSNSLEAGDTTSVELVQVFYEIQAFQLAKLC